MIHLTHPWLLAGLLALPLYLWIRVRQDRRRVVPFGPLQFHPGDRRRGAASIGLAIEVALIAVVAVGLARPFVEERFELIEAEGIDIVLVLDVSLSMLATDFEPTRLDALRRIADEFVDRSGGHRLGLVIFAKDAFVQSPLTTDRGSLRQLLDGVTHRTIDQGLSGGTAIGDALLLAASRLERSRIEGRDQALVVITDGESNEGSDPNLAARYVRHLGIHFYAIGVGGHEPVTVTVDGELLGDPDDPYLAYLDDRQLEAISSTAGGEYYRATDVTALESIFGHLGRLQSRPLEARTAVRRNELTRWLCLPAAALFVAHLFVAGLFARRPYR